MAAGPDGRLRNFNIAIAWMGTFICCTLAMVYFYGSPGAKVIYPLRSHAEESLAVIPTALFATLVSSWIFWFGARRKGRLVMTVLQVGVAIEASLSVYAIIGLQVAIAHWRSVLDLVFPAMFFAEYNWLTFILEVAPVTSVAAGLMVYGLLCFERINQVSDKEARATSTMRDPHL